MTKITKDFLINSGFVEKENYLIWRHESLRKVTMIATKKLRGSGSYNVLFRNDNICLKYWFGDKEALSDFIIEFLS